MSDIHILDGTGATVRVACHLAVPAANNLAGVSQQVAWRNSGHSAASVMPIGTGAGQITQPEADALAAGTLAEIVIDAQPEAKASAPERLAMLREIYREAQAQLAEQLRGLRYFGATFTRA